MFKLLKDKAKEFGFNLSDEQLGMFREYLRQLEEFNSHTNLVSSTETVIEKHFLDSLSLGLTSSEIDFSQSLKVIDIGIGGGFPGIPLVIAFPHWKLCAVDSIAKKLKFIELLSEKLGMQNQVEIVAARAEELAQVAGIPARTTKREEFDLAVTRAVARLNVICEYCLPFVKEGGYFVAYKAKTATEELEEAQGAIYALGGKYITTISTDIAGDKRNLVVIKKIAPTPEKYPRKPGRPTKKPLV